MKYVFNKDGPKLQNKFGCIHWLESHLNQVPPDLSTYE